MFARYLARDARLDDWVGAKRIEWSYDDQQNFTWMAINDHTSQSIACGSNPKPPPLKAFARAGSDVTIQWTNVPRHHLGPSMSVSWITAGPASIISCADAVQVSRSVEQWPETTTSQFLQSERCGIRRKKKLGNIQVVAL